MTVSTTTDDWVAVFRRAIKKQVGPGWLVMPDYGRMRLQVRRPGVKTQSINLPYAWEEALDACQAKGWRLPCIGEVDFLIDNIYRGQTSRAYQMLTGSGECYLVNPAASPNQRIDFWTGTEANDATAWTFYFDTQTKTIGRESNIIKGRRLPCLCVKKDPNQGSGLPPCYNKRVERN